MKRRLGSAVAAGAAIEIPSLAQHRADDPHRSTEARCRNCGSFADQQFCPACGQTLAVHPPTVREFLHEFIGHHVALDGTLWRTLTALLFQPGRLTADYFAGRRARYIAPLRLYLTFSLIFFAVSGWSGGSFRFGNESIQFKLPSEMPTAELKDRVVLGPRSSTMTRTGIAIVDDRIAHIEAMTIEQRADRMRSGMRTYLPYVLIVLVPVLALFLKMLYWNRHRLYGEHLVVAFHAQTVGFIFALIGAIPIGDFFGSLTFCVLMVQGFIALRRVYGGRRGPTLVRELLLLVFYGTTVLVALTLTATLALAF